MELQRSKIVNIFKHVTTSFKWYYNHSAFNKHRLIASISKYRDKYQQLASKHNFEKLCTNDSITLTKLGTLYRSASFGISLLDLIQSRLLGTSVRYNIPDIQEPLTNSEISRLRYGKSFENQFLHLGPRWGLSFSLYKDICPCWDQVQQFLENFNVFSIEDSSTMFDVLKKISTLAKTYNFSLCSFWMYLVNLETFGWYHGGEFDDEAEQEIVDWTVAQKVHLYNNNPSTFYDQFEHEVRAIFHSARLNTQQANKFSISLKEFLDNPYNYCLSGSSHLAVRIKIDGEKPRRTKKSAYLSLSKNQLARWILQYQQDSAKIIMKQETGKVRPVINAGDHLFLQMSYIDYYLQHLFHGNPLSTLWTSRRQDLLWKRYLIENIRTNSFVHVPVDQSHFDHQPDRRMLQIINETIMDVLPKQFEYLKVMQLIIDEMKLPTIIKLPNNHIIKATKGILSGWKWTAFYDTIINIATFNMAKRQSNILNSVMFKAQGDDDLIVVNNESQAYRILKAYTDMNFEVNPSKTFISTDLDEYLRIYYDTNGCRGYLARGIRSVLIASPINKPVNELEIRASGIKTQWMVLQNRGGQNVIKHLVHDLTNAYGINSVTITNWLYTPSSLGGGGLFTKETFSPTSVKPGTFKEPTSISNLRLVSSDKYSRKLLGTGLSRDTQIDTKGEFVSVTYYKRCGEFHVRNGYLRRPRFTTQNTYLIAYLTEYARDTKDFVPLFKLMDLPSQQTFEAINKRGSRRILFDWLDDRLPFSPPEVQNWSIDNVSIIAQDHFDDAFATLLSFRKFSYSDLLAVAVQAEQMTRRTIGKLTFALAN